MKIINLTPHPINFVREDGSDLITINPSGMIARVTAKTVSTGNILVEIMEATKGVKQPFVNIPATATQYGVVEGLPNPENGTIYIVSSLVAQRVPDRSDVFIPNESVRDESGKIIGCKSLGHI